MTDSIFREYDIRGKVGSEILLEDVYALGQAIAYYYLSHYGFNCTVTIGRDGREHSLAFKEQLVRALIDSGINVIDCGICPTPVMYFSLHIMPVQGTLMITASHNGKEYNGIKLCLGKDSLWGKQIQNIKYFYNQRKYCKGLTKGYYRERNIVERYISWLIKHFAHLKDFQIPFAIDCLEGATGSIIKSLKDEYGWGDVKILNASITNDFKHEPDPCKDKNMQELRNAIKGSSLSFGIAFDGDGDRMSAVTSEGELLLGDKLGALFIQSILSKNLHANVIFDVKCSSLVEETVTKLKGILHKSPSGHSIVKHMMKTTNAIFAGEYSCHFFFNDRYFGYDDGIYSFLRLCSLLYESKQSLDSLISNLPHYISSPEYRIPCHIEVQDNILDSTYKFYASKNDTKIVKIDGIQASTAYGWGLVRKSNTQPEVCLRFESQTIEGLKKIQLEFAHILQNHMPIELLEMVLK